MTGDYSSTFCYTGLIMQVLYIYIYIHIYISLIQVYTCLIFPALIPCVMNFRDAEELRERSKLKRKKNKKKVGFDNSTALALAC